MAVYAHMLNNEPTRIRNFNTITKRYKDEDELPWLRIPGLEKFEFERPLVLINGAFDVLHYSHMRLICLARLKAKTLVCALDGDEKVVKEKGEGRPIMTFVERATTLGHMPIDYLVEISNEGDFRKLIKLIKPDLRVQGYDYISNKTRFPEVKRVFVRDTGMHTSEIIRRCKEA